jgi:hypothetical protein
MTATPRRRLVNRDITAHYLTTLHEFRLRLKEEKCCAHLGRRRIAHRDEKRVHPAFVHVLPTELCRVPFDRYEVNAAGMELFPGYVVLELEICN